MNTQTDAQRLATSLMEAHNGHSDEGMSTFSEAADELRRLEAEVLALRGAVPPSLTVSQCSTSQYAAGWNDCREAMVGSKVPTFNGPASRKLADLQAHGWQVNGYHIQRQDGDTWKHGAITAGGMVLWWHGKQDAASPDKCPTCGSDCNEIDELAKAEREIERIGTLYSESWPIVESGWRFALGDLQCTGFAVERAVFVIAKGST